MRGWKSLWYEKKRSGTKKWYPNVFQGIWVQIHTSALCMEIRRWLHKVDIFILIYTLVHSIFNKIVSTPKNSRIIKKRERETGKLFRPIWKKNNTYYVYTNRSIYGVYTQHIKKLVCTNWRCRMIWLSYGCRLKGFEQCRVILNLFVWWGRFWRKN